MANGVNIPVNVTGDDEARRKLGAVGQAVGGVGGAVEQGGKSQESANRETKKAGELFEDFDRKAEKLVKQTLGMVNPQFAQAADLLFDINDGVLKVTSGMLGLAAAGVGIGVIVAIFQSIAARAQEAEAALQKLIEAENKRRGIVLSERSKAAEQMATIGINPSDDALRSVMKDAAAMNDPTQDITIPKEIAMNAAMARELAKKLGVPFDQQQYLAGVAVSGAKPIAFGGTEKEQRSVLESVMKAGGGEAAAAVRDNLFREMSEGAKRDVLPRDVGQGSRRTDRIATLLQEAVESGKWTDEQINEARSYLHPSRQKFVGPDREQITGEAPASVRLAQEILSRADVATRGAPIDAGPRSFQVNDPKPDVKINVNTAIFPGAEIGRMHKAPELETPGAP